jgi:mitotic spindle assembly checkpoint protein MAD2B
LCGFVADCSWELVAYLKSPSPDTIKKGQLWIPADDEGWDQSFTISSIKSMRSSCLDMQLYVEHPVVRAMNERLSDSEQDYMLNSAA